MLLFFLSCSSTQEFSDPCTDPDLFTSLSVTSKDLEDGFLLIDAERDVFYLVSGLKIYQTSVDGQWEKLYEYEGSDSQSVVSAVLDSTARKLYFLTSAPDLFSSSTDILELNLSDKTAISLLTSQGPSSCVGGFLSFDTTVKILYATCQAGLYQKKSGEDWTIISDSVSYVGVDAAVAFSKGADSYICIASDNGILCRVNGGAWERLEEATGVASAPSLNRQLHYDAVNDRLFVAIERGSDAAASAGQPVCSLLVSEGTGPLQEPVSLNGDCIESFTVNETTGDLYLVGTSCGLYRYSNGSLTSVGTFGTPLAIVPSGGSTCASRLVINSSDGVLYSFAYDEDSDADSCKVGACPVTISDIIAMCVGP